MVKNFNRKRAYDATIESKCEGGLLLYAATKSNAWTPAKVRVDPQSKVDPAGTTTLVLPTNTNGSLFPTVGLEFPRFAGQRWAFGF